MAFDLKKFIKQFGNEVEEGYKQTGSSALTVLKTIGELGKETKKTYQGITSAITPKSEEEAKSMGVVPLPRVFSKGEEPLGYVDIGFSGGLTNVGKNVLKKAVGETVEALAKKTGKSVGEIVSSKVSSLKGYLKNLDNEFRFKGNDMPSGYKQEIYNKIRTTEGEIEELQNYLKQSEKGVKKLTQPSIFENGQPTKIPGKDAEFKLGLSLEDVSKKVPENLPKSPVQKLTDILNEVKPLRAEQEKLYSVERGKRFAGAEKAYTSEGGIEGYFSGLRKLKGELPKTPVSEAIKGKIRNTIEEHAEDFFRTVQQHKWLNTGEKTTAQNALAKVFSGQLPTEGELTLLETIFGQEFAESLRLSKPWEWNLWNVLTEIGGTMKVLMSSFADLSSFGRQLITYVTRNPIKGIKLLKTGADTFVSERYYRMIRSSIEQHEFYPLARKFGVAFTDVGTGQKLDKVDEQFMVRLIKNIPGLGDIVAGTERAFNAMTNKARADWFFGLTDDLLKSGYNPATNPKAFKETADFVNSFTGRASLPRVLENANEVMNLMLYSPRLIKSRIDILASPVTYINAPAPLRKEVWKTLLSYYGTLGLVLGGAVIAGAEVETDYRSSDFLKVKVGNRRWDFTGGLAQYLRVIGQLSSGERKTAQGKIVESSQAETLKYFVRGKISPLASLGWDVAAGKTFLGEDITLQNLAKDHLLNMTIQDILDAQKEVGWAQALLFTGIPATLGIGTQSYETKPPKINKVGLPSESKTKIKKIKSDSDLPSNWKK